MKLQSRISDTVMMKSCLKKFWTVLIALGESTVIEDPTQLLVCVCSINGNLKVMQELRQVIGLKI